MKPNEEFGTVLKPRNLHATTGNEGRLIRPILSRRRWLASMALNVWPNTVFHRHLSSAAAFSSSMVNRRRKPLLIRQRFSVFRDELPFVFPCTKLLSSVPTTAHEQQGLILPSHPDKMIRSVMAPMVSASDYPFRHFLSKYHGVDLTFTQMLHAHNFVVGKVYRECHLDLWETGKQYPDFLPSQLACLEGFENLPNGPTENDTKDMPVIVQLAGHDVDTVLRAATRILEHVGPNHRPVSGFDLNLGCPQGIARKGNYGAFLMESDFDRVCEILTALKRMVPSETAVSAKIRLPTSDELLKERIPRLVDTGINFMTIHGRTLYENKTKVGPCHVERIGLAVQLARSVDPTFPVIANGGMEDFVDVQDILRNSGAVAAMSSEALLETPNIFQQTSRNLTPRQLLEQQFGFARDYLHVCATVTPPLPGLLGRTKGGSFYVAKGHLFKFLHRYLQENVDLRDKLAEAKPVDNILRAHAWLDELYGRYDNLSDEELENKSSASPEASWYRRHRKPDRRVHQKEVRVSSAFLPSFVQEEESIETRKKKIQERIADLKAQKKLQQQKATASAWMP